MTEKNKQVKDEVTPIDSGKTLPVEDIQSIAKKNYEKAEALAAEGKQPPPLPATPGNLSSFQNLETLPEGKRKELEPVDIKDHPKAVERATTAKEGNEGAQIKKGQAFENIPPTTGGSVTDELLGGNK